MSRVLRALTVALTAVGCLPADAGAAAPPPQTIAAWNAYVAATEARIARELRARGKFLGTDFEPAGARLRAVTIDGAIPVAQLCTTDGGTSEMEVPAGVVSHWRGSVFLPGASLDALVHRLRHPSEHDAYQEDVQSLRVLGRTPEQLRLAIRVTRSAIVSVTYDTEHVVRYRRESPTRVSSRSVSTRIVEIENAGTRAERPLTPAEDRGFLWRMNSYWRYEQIDGGVMVELESLTLSRAIPAGLGIVVEPIVDRIARESMTRTLEGLRRTHGSTRVSAARREPTA